MKSFSRHSPRFAQRGTTLVEILVSIVLLSVGLLGLVGLHARASQTVVDAENRNNAAGLANEIVSAMWITHNPADSAAVKLAFTNWQNVTTRALPSSAAYPATYAVTATDASGAALPAGAARITLTWQAPGQQVAANTTAVNNQYYTTVAIP